MAVDSRWSEPEREEEREKGENERKQISRVLCECTILERALTVFIHAHHQGGSRRVF